MTDPTRAAYAALLRAHYTDAYRASLQPGGPGDAPPPDTDLGPTARSADPATLPAAAREAFDFYMKHFEAADTATVRACAVPVGGTPTFAVRVKKDGDDGYLEVYDAAGRLQAAGRTYIEVAAWGTRDWLRAQVDSPENLPTELRDAADRTLWGKPLPPGAG